MRYVINPYSQIIFNGGKYEFYAPPSKEETVKIEFSLNSTTIDSLLIQTGLTKEELIDIVGVDEANFLIEHEIYVTSLTDDNNVSSRTNQFYKQHLTLEQQTKIRNSNVLVLGCGGIGSSIAWLLAGLGIKKMTVLDFDIVEESNLNRMFMFNKSDIGRKKVLVLKDKLQQLYSEIEINAIDAKITSEIFLSEVCLRERYDLIIKALDSPSTFPIWLDSVCKKHSLCYVGGITLRDRIMIGPTYIPSVAEDGWSDIIRIDDSSERIYGKVPSIGTMLFNATDRIATESVKILLQNYDACEYKNCILSENIFTGEQETIRNKKSRYKDDGIKKAAAFLNLTSMIGFGCCAMYSNLYFVVVFILSCFLPFCSYYGKKYILLQTFINSTISSVFLSLHILKDIGFNMLTFCLISIVIASLMSILSLCINSIVIKILEKRLHN